MSNIIKSPVKLSMVIIEKKWTVHIIHDPYPSNKFFKMRNISMVGDNVITNGLSLLFYDETDKIYR